MNPIVHGIPQCDTVRKARAWLDQRGVAHRFVDFRKSPPTQAQLVAWCTVVGWAGLLNRRGTTWRKLEPQRQALVIDVASAVALMLAHPSAIKRPVVETPQRVLVGFDPEAWARLWP